jgi:hypothetical protein
MRIIWIDERACGRPRMTLSRIGMSSEKHPAESRYRTVFLRLSKVRRPYSTATTMEEKLHVSYQLGAEIGEAAK